MFQNRELDWGPKDSDRNRQLIKEEKDTPENRSGLESLKTIKKICGAGQQTQVNHAPLVLHL